VQQTKPYGAQYSYSGGGITLAQLAFTRLTGTTLQEAFETEVAAPLGLTRSGYFQPLDETRLENAAFGGMLGIWENRNRGYHYYPEHAAAGFWTTPTELAKIGVALSKSVREGNLLRKATAERMVTPVLEQSGLCLFRDAKDPDLAGHSGWNSGFLTAWGFSLTQDLCVAVMINRSIITIHKKLSKVSNQLFQHAKEQIGNPV